MTALDLRASETFPSRRDEAWKYSDLRRWLRAEPPLSPALSGPEPANGPFREIAADEVVIANGRLNWWADDDLGPGIEVTHKAAPDAPRLADHMPMAALAAARALEGAYILTFRAGQSRALCLRWISDANETGHHARVGVVVESGAEATLLESFEGRGQAYLSNTLLEIYLEPGARLERVTMVEDAADALAVASTEVHVSAGSTYHQTVIATGAKLQRIETHIAHGGEGAQVRADGLYLLDGARHADLTSAVTHTGPGGQTSQLVKGVARDASRGVFQGRIVVERGADGTDARMGHHALIADEKAEIDAKPELIIYADEVQCAHGNTVGNLDENALFYMQQRGIPIEEARALLTQAFLFEGVDRIEHEGAREVVRAWLTARL